jgi:carboxypeptidase Taq
MMGLTPENLRARGITIRRPELYPTGFCWGSIADVRLAVEAYEDRPLKVIQNGMHEYGHLVYLMALAGNPPKISGQPVGQVTGYGLHEVSAMFFEFAGQKRKFFELAAPLIRKEFGARDGDPAWSAENLYRNANNPSLDSMEWGGCELSLMPQMAWRTLAERRILDNEMTVAELSDFRAKTMAKMTGLPEKDLDDPSQVFDSSHWAGEEYGYFYAYITGGIGAAMLHEKLERERGTQLEAARTLEEYLKIHRDFMHENIYKYASLYKPQELLEKALGQAPSLDAYIRHLERGTRGAFGASTPPPKPGSPPPLQPSS